MKVQWWALQTCPRKVLFLWSIYINPFAHCHFSSLKVAPYFQQCELKMGKQDKRANEATKFFVVCSKNAATKIFLPVDLQAKHTMMPNPIRRLSSSKSAVKTNVVASSNCHCDSRPSSSCCRSVFCGSWSWSHQEVHQTASHQVQVDRQNQRKQMEINSQAHMKATNLVDAERKKPPGEPRRST